MIRCDPLRAVLTSTIVRRIVASRILNRVQGPQIVDIQEIIVPLGLVSSTGSAGAGRRPLAGVGSRAHPNGQMACHHRSD
jgi:hypothetical protein